MSRLKSLLRVAPASTRNTQQFPLHGCPPVAQHTQQPQQMASNDNWREFETLLNLVAPAFNTPAHEVAAIRQAALRDLSAALSSFRQMANQTQGNRK